MTVIPLPGVGGVGLGGGGLPIDYETSQEIAKGMVKSLENLKSVVENILGGINDKTKANQEAEQKIKDFLKSGSFAKGVERIIENAKEEQRCSKEYCPPLPEPYGTGRFMPSKSSDDFAGAYQHMVTKFPIGIEWEWYYPTPRLWDGLLVEEGCVLVEAKGDYSSSFNDSTGECRWWPFQTTEGIFYDQAQKKAFAVNQYKPRIRLVYYFGTRGAKKAFEELRAYNKELHVIEIRFKSIDEVFGNIEEEGPVRELPTFSLF